MTDNAKPTPGPWDWNAGFSGCHIIRKGGGHFLATLPWSGEPDGREPDARFIAAACNSYAKHCADPLAAAESDLLGEALAAIKSASDFTNVFLTATSGNPEWNATRDQIDKQVKAKLAAILAKAEGRR